MKPEHHVLIIGCGGMGMQHISALIETGRATVSVYDVNNKNYANINSRYPSVKYWRSFEDIQIKVVDLVIIATPANTHIELATWCIARSKNFVIEKPLAVNADGLEEMINEAEARCLKTAVAFPRRYGLPYKLIKDQLFNGYIGELKMIRTNFSQDYRKYRPDYQTTYYAQIDQGGGILADALSHHVNLACFYAGEIKTISAFSERLVLENVNGDDAAVINLKFNNGVIGTISGNQFQKKNEDFIELIGTQGNVSYERVSGAYSYHRSDNRADGIFSHYDGEWQKILLNQANNFLDMLTSKNFAATSLREGLHVVNAISATKFSSLNHTSVTVS
jgi:predicted dehydrogenase